MRKKSDSDAVAKERGSLLFLVMALVVVVGLATFFYFRTTASADYLTQRNIRFLSRLSQRIESEVNNTESILVNYAKDPTNRLKVPEITVIPLAQIEVDPETPACAGPDAPPLWVEGATRVLRRQCTGEYLLEESLFVYRRSLSSWFLPWLESEFFDDTFLADAAGNVLLQSEETGLRMQWMPPLAERGEDEEDAAVEPTPRRPRLVSWEEIVRIGGRKYRLFLQPIHLQAPAPARSDSGEAARTNDWVLGGLVSTARFRSESLALDPTEVLALTLLVLFAVVAWPFVKLWTLGSRDKIVPRDVLFQGFSLLIGGGLVALCLVALAYYPNLKREVDRQLEQIGDRIANSVQKETDSALRQLEVLSQGFSPTGDQIKTELLRPGFGITLEEYPYLDMVFWTDEAGQQQEKWTVKREVTPLIHVGHREYVRKVTSGRTWTRDLGGREVDFFQEAILSVTTGERLTAFSTPWRGVAEAVAVLITRLISLDRLVLPTGFDFAVIEPDGAVLYHSSPSRSLGENFFVEAEMNPKLRSVVAARNAELLTIRYLGRDTRLHVRPIASTPLVLLVLFDKTVLRSVNLETLFLGAVLLSLYGGMLLMVYILITYLGRVRHFRWVWPDRDYPMKYPVLLVGLALFAAELLRQAVFDPPSSILASVFLVPIQAAGFVLLVLASGPRDWSRHRRWGWGLLAVGTIALIVRHLGAGSVSGAVGAVVLAGLAIALASLTRRESAQSSWVAEHSTPLYLAAAVASLGVFALLPAALLFRVVYFDHLMIFVKQAQLEIVRGLEDRKHRVEDQYRWQELSGERLLPADFVDSRLRSDLDLAFPPFFQTCYELPGAAWSCPQGASSPASFAEADPGRSAGIQAELWQYAPFLSRFSVAARHLFRHRADDLSWSWQIGKQNRDLPVKPLLLTSRPDLGSPRYRLLSHIPVHLARPARWRWAALPLLASLVLFAVVLSVARRVFLVDFQTPRSTAEVPGAELTDRWRQAIAAKSGSESSQRADARLRLLAAECGFRSPLQQVGSAVAEHPDFALLDREALIDLIAAEAAGYYRTLLAGLSTDERMSIAQLAHGAVVTARRRQVLRRLLELGLVVRDPDLRPMNESFSRFVHREVGARELRQWELTGSVSLWRRLRQPMFFVLLAVAALLFATQRQLFNETLALISAAAAGIPALFRLLGLLRQPPNGAGTQG